jgi:NAD(P)-dependent dehydrogenase (short-subunit alcohol dehydrogenase family)
MTARLQGRVAIVTGAGNGIGAAITERYLSDGASVVAVDLSADMTIDSGPHGDRLLKVVADVVDPKMPGHVVDATIKRFGRLDIIVNNAGFSQFGSLQEMADDMWQQHFNVNVTAAMRLSRSAVPYLKLNGVGRIINTATISVHRANLNHSAYSASKAAVVGLTNALAFDLGPEKITVNAILPGMVLTRMMSKAMADYPERESYLRNLSVFGRMANPSEIAGPASFLASDDASFVTGHSLVVDGGVMAKI